MILCQQHLTFPRRIKMLEINNAIVQKLFNEAVVNPDKCQSMEMPITSADDGKNELKVLLPGANVAIYRNQNSKENILCACFNAVVVIYDEDGNETERHPLNPGLGFFGCVVPAGAWHSFDVLDPSVIYVERGDSNCEILDDTYYTFQQKESE